MYHLRDKSVVILGLGLHGGGVSSAKYAVHVQAKNIVVSDMASRQKLAGSIQQLSHLPIQYELDGHNIDTIMNADIVIKNPAIPRDNKYVHAAHTIETDISLYWQETHMPTWAVTGTKGKSSVCTAVYNLIQQQTSLCAALAGNITYSPLHLLLDNTNPDLVVLELSSFQLGDLNLVDNVPYDCILLGVLTNIMPDHQNYYPDMQSYAHDKLTLFHNLSSHAHAVLPYSDWGEQAASSLQDSQCVWHADAPLPAHLIGAWIDNDTIYVRKNQNTNAVAITHKNTLPYTIPLQNIMIVAAICIAKNLTIPHTQEAWKTLFAIPHRKEYLGTLRNRTFYNDSAATIPQAIQIDRFPSHSVHVIAGGTDKNLSTKEFLSPCQHAKHIYLLDGSFTDRVIPMLYKHGIAYSGPYRSMQDALLNAYEQSLQHDIIILSPGCASFGMFLHEFDRGNQFKQIVKALFISEQSMNV